MDGGGDDEERVGAVAEGRERYVIMARPGCAVR